MEVFKSGEAKLSQCHPASDDDRRRGCRPAREDLTAARWCFLNFGFAKTAFEVEVLEQRTQLLAARFAPRSSKKGARSLRCHLKSRNRHSNRCVYRHRRGHGTRAGPEPLRGGRPEKRAAKAPGRQKPGKEEGECRDVPPLLGDVSALAVLLLIQGNFPQSCWRREVGRIFAASQRGVPTWSLENAASD